MVEKLFGQPFPSQLSNLNIGLAALRPRKDLESVEERFTWDQCPDPYQLSGLAYLSFLNSFLF